MNLQLRMAVEGNLEEFMNKRAKGVASAVTRAVRGVTYGLQREISRQARKADFKSDGLGKLIKAKVNPQKGYKPDAEGVVYSVARVKRPHVGEVDLLEVFDKARTISAQGDKWLAIATENAPFGTGRGSSRRRARPGKLSANVFAALVFIKTKKPNLAMLAFVDKKTGEKRVAYWLAKQVKLRKRLNIERAEKKWLPKLEGKINTNLDRFVYRTGDKL